MIKAIIFDFDGVLIESAQIKTDAFRKLFSAWKKNVDEIVNYHIQHTGISRFVKFRYIYENILNEPYSEEIGIRLGSQFSEIVLDEIKNAPFVKGTEEFLNQNYQERLCFIASGTPQEELNDIVSSRNLFKYFRGVFGTPPTKAEIVETILKKYSINREDVIFIGDAESDKKAAADTGIKFILRNTPENFGLSCMYKINDLTQLNKMIEVIKR